MVTGKNSISFVTVLFSNHFDLVAVRYSSSALAGHRYSL